MASDRERQRRRRLIAEDAVRLLAEAGTPSVDAARRKAARRCGFADPRDWPELREVEEAWAERRRLFAPADGIDHAGRLRQIALDVMTVFADFDPQLVGSLAAGMADAHSSIVLRLYADAPEHVVFRLLDRRIDWQEAECRLSFGSGRREIRPAFRCRIGDTGVELVVLRPADRSDPPRDPATGRPEPALDAAGLRAALQSPPQERSVIGR
jgi:hypothetical protein